MEEDLLNRQKAFGYLLSNGEEEFYLYVGIRIKALRKEQGYDVRFLASYLNISKSQFHKYERGESRIPTRFIVMLMDLFKVNIHEILGQRDPNEDLRVDVEIIKKEIVHNKEENQQGNKELKKENQQLNTKMQKLEDDTIKENKELRAHIIKLEAENQKLKESTIKENKELKTKVTKLGNENKELKAKIKALKTNQT